MSVCEMCGKDTSLLTATIESVEMQVCNSCARYGKVKKEIVTRSFIRKKNQTKLDPNEEQEVIGNFSVIIRQEREKRKLSQEEFARFLNERETIVAKWEAGVLRPSLAVARRLQRKLKVRIVIASSGSDEMVIKKTPTIATLGDMVKIRKRR
ncbi:TIGR00270 family protein [Candidatus Woesearchaeota archaeon]|jgi:uncharacterized protein (TIGR00270 family)|nr:TIGR00270 family protein [Candidatus Woesearchaeota archaeon]